MHRLGATLSIVLLAGCAGEVALDPPGLSETEILAQAESLRARASDRARVHAMLGEPRIAAADASAEVFQLSSRQRQALVVFTPYPVPLPAPSLVSDGYTLVTYDRTGAVSGVDAGFRRSDSGVLAAGLLLRAGDFEFLHGQSDALLVSRERYLGDLTAAAPDEGCTVLVGCEQECGPEPGDASSCGVCWTRLQIDDGAVQELPLSQLALWRIDVDANGNAASAMAAAAAERCRELGGEASGSFCSLRRWPLVPLRLPPGRHTFVATSESLAGEARGMHECVAGTLQYAMLGGRLTESYSLARQLRAGLRTGAADGQVSFSTEVPAALAGRRVLVRPQAPAPTSATRTPPLP